MRRHPLVNAALFDRATHDDVRGQFHAKVAGTAPQTVATLAQEALEAARWVDACRIEQWAAAIKARDATAHAFHAALHAATGIDKRLCEQLCREGVI